MKLVCNDKQRWNDKNADMNAKNLLIKAYAKKNLLKQFLQKRQFY